MKITVREVPTEYELADGAVFCKHPETRFEHLLEDIMTHGEHDQVYELAVVCESCKQIVEDWI